MMSRQLMGVHPTDRAQSSIAYSRDFATALGSVSAWSRDARAALILADRLGIKLDEEELALYDVRDLQALCFTLQRRLAQ